DDFIETVVRMMQQHVLSSYHFEEIRVWRQRWIAGRLKRTVFQLGQRVIANQRSKVRHRQWAIELVGVRFRQIEKLEKQLEKIFRTIGFHFQPHGVASAGASQFLLDRSQKVLRFLIVNVEIAVAGDAKRVHAVQDQAGK